MMPDAFERWLAAATRGLPTETAAEVREELAEHYADAVHMHLLAGLPPAAAHAAALAELGDEQAVAQGLQQAHGSARRYLRAALLGLALLLMYPALLVLPGAGGAAFNPAFFLPVVYILYSFRTLFRDYYSPHSIEPVVTLAGRGIMAMCLLRIVARALYHHPPIMESYTLGLWDAAGGAELLLNLAGALGLFTAAAAMMVLGEQTLRLRLAGPASLRPLCVLALFCGLSMAGFGLASLYGAAGPSALLDHAAAISAILAAALWTRYFFRAGRPLLRPA